MKAHAAGLVTRQFDQVMSKLARRRVPFRVAPPTDDTPWERAWVEVTPDRPEYDSRYDAGLAIEVLPADPYPAVVEPPPFVTTSPVSSSACSRRRCPCANIDDALRRLSLHLDLGPAGGIRTTEEHGHCRVPLAFGIPTSCAAPRRAHPVDSPAGRYRTSWGPAPYPTPVAVHDLDTRRADLRSRQSRYSDHAGGIRLNTGVVASTLIKMVESGTNEVNLPKGEL